MKAQFRQTIRERREYAPGSAEWRYLTRAARTYLRIIRGAPSNQWSTE